MAALNNFETIWACVSIVQNIFPNRFILVGGAGNMLTGSGRQTDDIDLLIPTDTDASVVTQSLLRITGFTAPNGVLAFHGKTTMTIDLLHSVAGDATFEELRQHTTTVGGIPLLDLETALAIKIKCYNLRPDNESGDKKRSSDIADIKWLAQQMVGRGQEMSESTAKLFPIGHYYLVLVRLAMTEHQVSLLVKAGVKKMLRPWNEDTDDQKEFFEFFAEPGTCPLTGELFDEDEGNDESKE
ncbi:hypothetical protein SEUCBS139899_007636 [Sporothrix eucalyptigena]|uniref:Uncharacterized protein n=1 Tax=Sporothrix eucalyptigena TaxID=1812306 RepID=A0ABP0AT83_9PEZI